jgi:hypothetical protein
LWITGDLVRRLEGASTSSIPASVRVVVHFPVASREALHVDAERERIGIAEDDLVMGGTLAAPA